MLPMGELCAYRKVFHYPSMVKEAPTKSLPGRGSQRKEKLKQGKRADKTKERDKETKKNDISITKTTPKY